MPWLFLPLLPVQSVAAPPPARQDSRPAPAAPAPAPGEDIVVVGRRIPPDPPPIDTVSRPEIDSYGADSIGDLIARLKSRVPGGNPPVIVNGRRLGSIADITALPPEALERIEILPPAAGARRGLGGGTPLFNLVLKKHFKALNADASASTTSDGGADEERATLTSAAIAGDRRDNLSLYAQRLGGLRYGDRFAADVLAAANDAPRSDASLIAASRAVGISAGKAQPIGNANLSLSLSGNLQRSERTVDADGIATTQRNGGESANLSTTVDGLIGRHFWSVILSTSIAQSRSTGGAAAFTSRSATQGASGSANLSGPLLQLFGTSATYTVTTGLETSRSSQVIAGAGSSVRTRNAFNDQAGFDLTLHQRGTGHSLLGDLGFRLQGQVNGATGDDTLLGYEGGVTWSPFKLLSLEGTRSREALGTGGASGDVTIVSDVPVFDPVTQQNVRVRQILGSNPLLHAPAQQRSTVRATLNQAVGASQFSLSAYYTRDDTRDPILQPQVSSYYEQAFPDRFLRTDGALVEIDTRPLNGSRQSNTMLTLNFGANGVLGQAAAPAPGPHASAGPHALYWSANLGYADRLGEMLQLRADGPRIDLRSAQIGPGGGGARHMINAQTGLSTARWSGQMNLRWSSDSRLLGQGGAMDGVYAEPLRIGIDAQWLVGRSPAAGTPPKGVRVHLAVDNMLNARPSVHFPDRPTPFAQLPDNLDPVGRRIRLTLRAPLR